MRKEVWIYPDGVRRLHRTDLNGNNNYKMIVNEEKRFREMTTEEVKVVNCTYLFNLINKWYYFLNYNKSFCDASPPYIYI